MCTANLLDKANNPEADFASLLFAARIRAYMKRCLDFKYKKFLIFISAYLLITFHNITLRFYANMINISNKDKCILKKGIL